MKITNTQPGPRGINAIGGPVLIDPKQTVDVKVYERERSGIEASGWFQVEGNYEPDPDKPAAAPDHAAEIARLQGEVAERDKQIAELKQKLPETDIEKMTVPELRAHLAFHDVAYDGTRDKKADLVEKAKRIRAA